MADTSAPNPTPRESSWITSDFGWTGGGLLNTLGTIAVGAGGLALLVAGGRSGTPGDAGDGDNSGGGNAPANHAPTDLTLAAAPVDENAAGAVVGQLGVVDADVQDTHRYAVLDDRFEVVGRTLRLKAGVSLDHETAPAVAVGVRVTDTAGASLSREFIVSVRDVAETTLWQGTSADDHWQSTSMLDDDAVLPGAGRDKIDTGGGDDVLVLIGRTAAGQFTQADLDRLVARDTQLQPHLDADHLNDRATPLLAAGARFAMGNGVDRLIVLGAVDLRGASLEGIEAIDLQGELTMTAAQFQSLGLRHLRGLGDAGLRLVNEGPEPVEVDLSRLAMSGVRRLSLDGAVVLVADAQDLADVTHLGGWGTLKGSAGSPVPDLAGRAISVRVLAADGSEVSPATHRAASVTRGLLQAGGLLADSLVGGTGDDRLIGAGGDDQLSGGDGNDVLIGGAGQDVMDGGAGDDVFVVLGDLRAGGKIDHPLDDAWVGRPLSSLNGEWHDDTAGGAAETVIGGDGEDTLLVVGTADISRYRLSGIEHLAIRSDVRVLADGVIGLRTVQGDGSSILRLTSRPGAEAGEIDLGRIDLAGLGMLEIGAGLSVRIATLDDLGGARILSGAGSIVASDPAFVLDGRYTLSSTLAVRREDGGDARGAATVLGGFVSAPTTDETGRTVYPGSDADDLITGSAGDDELRSGRGTDVLNGKDGNDRYRIDGAGRKTLLDSAGEDTLDFSALSGSGPVVVNLSTGLALARTVSGAEVDIEIGGGSYAASRQPLDLMFLQDLSGSYSDDIRTVRGMLPGLIEQMRSFNPNTWFGAASFVDKPTGPFGSLGSGDYVYRTDSKLSADAARLQSAYDSMVVRFGGDGPESQLEALYQLALRTARDDASARTNDGEIDFRPGSQRFVVLTTDASFHREGDHAAAGPNNGDVILDGTPPGTGEDYPNPEAVGRAMRLANLIPIFAVTSGEGGGYQSLVDQLGFGSVVTLSSDSSNLVRAIQSGLASYRADIIENIVGTDDAAGDSLTGNRGANTLSGGAGNDTLTGLGGNDLIDGGDGDADVAVYRGPRADYDLRWLDCGWRVEVEGRRGSGIADGLDTLTRTVEVLRFSDGDVAVNSLKPVPLIGSDALFLRLGNYTTFALFADAAYADHNESRAELDRVAGLAWMSADALGLSATGKLGDVGRLSEEIARLIGLPFGRTYPEGYAFKNGIYTAANARACVARTADAVFLSFAGTNDPVDVFANDLPAGGFEACYQLFKPLLYGIATFANNAANGIAHVYVSGHSLGGAMVERYLKGHPHDDDTPAADPLGAKLKGVTFEAAPFDRVTSPLADTRLLQFEFARDLIADTGMNRGYVVDVVDTTGLGDALKSLYTREDGGAFAKLWAAATGYHRMATSRELTRLLDEQGLTFQPGSRDKLGGLISSEQIRVSMSFKPDGSIAFGPDDDELKIATLVGDILLAVKVLASLRSGDAAGVILAAGQLLLDVKDAFKNIFEFRKTTLGLAGEDQLYGGDTSDRLIGGEGNDYLAGGAGHDILEGGAGDDVLDEPSKILPSLTANLDRLFKPYQDILKEAAERTLDEGFGTGLNSLLKDVARDSRFKDSTFSKWLLADDANVAEIKGLLGKSKDFIKGLAKGAAIDAVLATFEELVTWRNRGDDTLIGGIGNDLYFIDTSRDRVIEHAGEGHDGVIVTGTATKADAFGVFADNRYVLPLNTEYGICRDDILKSENFILDASAHAEGVILVGNGGNNRLVGGSGHDILVGGADEDWLIGGDGDDQLYGGVLGSLTFSPVTPELQHVLDAARAHADAAAIDNTDFSYLRGGKGSDTLFGDRGDGDYFIIDIDRSSEVDQVRDFDAALAPDLLADFDKLVFSAEQLGVDADALDAVGLSGIAFDGLSADVLSEFNYQDLERIADYEVNSGVFNKAPTFLLDKSSGILWFDQDGSQDIGDQYPVAQLTFTLGSLTLFGADDILIMDSYSVLA